jgi:hypothetical protein
MARICDLAGQIAPSEACFGLLALGEKAGGIMGNKAYTARQAAYGMNKLRGKFILAPIIKSRPYCLSTEGVRILAGLLILREKVIKPLLAGICKKTAGRPPKNVRPIDTKYDKIRSEMPCVWLSGSPLGADQYPRFSRASLPGNKEVAF